MADSAVAAAERTLPHNLEAERSVLGSILVQNDAFNMAAQLIDSRDFYRDAHRRIFERMAALSERSHAIDFVTLKEELSRNGELDEVGGPAYVASLADGVPHSTNVEYYAKIVKEKSTLRNLIYAANKIVSDAYGAEQESDLILDEAESAIFAVADDRLKAGFVEMRDLVKENFPKIEQLFEQKRLITGVPTGFADMDGMTRGLQAGDLVIVAARPSMGKTSLVLNIAQYVAAQPDLTVGFFSLEMSKESLFLRLLTSEAHIDSHRLMSGAIGQKDYGRIAHALETLSNMRLHIDDTAGIGVMEMRAKARRLKSEHGLSLLIVDYVQLMTGRGRFENRTLELASISRSIKGLAKELNVPIILLSQLSRAPEARSDHRPQLSDLRECVTGDTLVCLTDGRRVPICSLVGQTPSVWSVTSDSRVVAATSDKVWRVGARPVMRVSLANGMLLRATAEHRLLGVDGWKRVGDLRPGDWLAVATSRLLVDLHEHVEIRAAGGGGVALLDEPASAPPSTVQWDRVEAVEPAGEEDVYDLTVPGPSCWLADGIVSHNSGALEQDADLVVLIYRDDVYNKDPNNPDAGTAELILAKQRNGPTGVVKLAFLREQTRFANLAPGGGG
jgi:replicative DNA helicase